ncbi:hypothetical protein K469DRAFT_810538, partial [Zopfia rhizophila CBS 207.26]
KERLLNEAHTLNLIRQYTSIPVPKVLDYGVDDIANTFVTIERIYGITLDSLRQLTSNVTGLDGFILPPPRITETVPRVAWQPITLDIEEFVFIHGDLARHNIMVSPKTLEVTYIFD